MTQLGLRKAGLLDQATMCEFDALCLTSVEPLASDEIRALRERERVSQPVFAYYPISGRMRLASGNEERSDRMGRYSNCLIL